MEKATEARSKNEQGEELEAIKLATVNSVANGLTGLVDADSLKEGLSGLVEENTRATISSNNAPWVVKGLKTNTYYKITQNGLVDEIKGVAFTTNNVNVKQGKSVEIEIVNVTGEELQLSPTTSNGITITKGENNKITISATNNAEIGATATFTATAGTESDTCTATVVYDKAGAINRLIGNNVYYSVTLTGQTDPIDKWQVFYADEENSEVFIISEDILEFNTAIGGTNTTSNAQIYSAGTNSNSLASTTYGGKYNKEWLKVENAGLTGTTVNNNAKTTAYLCDSTNSHWSRYATGAFGTGTGTKTASTIENVYAVGGPTLELLYASVEEYDSSKICGILSSTALGYNDAPINCLSEPYVGENISTNGGWWLASPSNYSSNGGDMRNVLSGQISGNMINGGYSRKDNNLRCPSTYFNTIR